MRLVMFGTGPFAVPTFEALCASRHEIAALVTQPARAGRGKGAAAPSPMRAVAIAHGTPILDPDDVNSAEFLGRLAALHADLLVVADYGQILSREALASARLGAINLHGSLLPKYRGAAPINWALYRGEPETGVSVIGMTARVDAGPVLAQAATPIDPDEDAVALESRLAAIGAPLVCQTIDRLEAGAAEPLPQDASAATSARRLRKTDGAVDWSRAAAAIKDQVRALVPWPRAYTFWQRSAGEPLRLILGRVAVAEGRPGAEPGEVLRADKTGLVVAAGEGAVRVLQAQPAGRQMLAAAELLRGYGIEAGHRFGPGPDEG